MRRHLLCITMFAAMSFALPARAVERFPRPELPPGYEHPTTAHPAPRATSMQYVDVAVLLAALAAASYLILKRRSRPAIIGLTIASLLYFGFYRGGCVCPIGAIQHVTGSFADPSFLIPLAVLLFFLLPLVLALLVGRVFCGAVCPLGAMQDLVLLKPLRVPRWLEHGLSLFAYVYLGLAVLLAATGAGYVICRYDPFVPFFRLSGNFEMLATGGCVLLIAVFVGRPYCRFLCPMGVLFKHAARLTRTRVTITPDECIRCRLCEDACPFGAIRKPTESDAPRTEGKTRLALTLLSLPLIIIAGAWLGHSASPALAGAHPTVLRAREVRQGEADVATEPGKRTLAFRKTGRTTEQLYAQEAAILARFETGGAIFGGYLGLVAGGMLVALSVRRRHTDYEADRGTCLACGRCYEACPREHVRRRKLKEVAT